MRFRLGLRPNINALMIYNPWPIEKIVQNPNLLPVSTGISLTPAISGIEETATTVKLFKNRSLSVIANAITGN